MFFSKGHKNEFETAVVKEPSEFEPLKFYCNWIPIGPVTAKHSLSFQNEYLLENGQDWKQQKEWDGLWLSYAVLMKEWDSDTHCLLGHKAMGSL